MAKPDAVIEELVTANRILATEGIVDSFGHVSVRHPARPDRYLLSRARAPERIEADDIMEFTLEGEAVEARPDVQSVVHNHSPSTIPFGITGTKLRPLLHMCASIGQQVPLWDSHSKFGDTSLLVDSMAMGRDLAKRVGKGRTAFMRGHGAVVAGQSIRQAIWIAIYLELNAKLQMQALAMGKIKFLTNGEVDAIVSRQKSFSFNRAWENWCRRAGREMQEMDSE